MQSAPRYAIYFAPQEESQLAAFGEKWLGRTPEDPTQEREAPPSDFCDEEYRKLVESPRHYGFHATLKAPFELAQNKNADQLIQAIRCVSCTHSPFLLQPLRVHCIGKFLALVPQSTEPPLARLHAACLRKLDSFRAPLSDFDYSRHMAKKLSGRQQRLLKCFGYPFVLEEFRFHMTLTGNLPKKQRIPYKDKIERLASPALRSPVEVHGICLFHQKNRKAPFRLIERFPLTGNES